MSAPIFPEDIFQEFHSPIPWLHRINKHRRGSFIPYGSK
jgi:hypothetical protein